MTKWYEKYLNLPYQKYNCAGLLQHVWLKEKGYLLDIESSIDLDSLKEYRNDFIIGKLSSLSQIDRPRDMCAVVMLSRNVVGHIGIYIDGGYILHAHKDYNASIIQSTQDTFLLNPLYGYYNI